MIIFWRGYGGLVPAAVVASTCLVFMGIVLARGGLEYAQRHQWPFGAILILSAVACRLLDRWLRSRGSLLPIGRSKTDPNDPRKRRKRNYISERWERDQSPLHVDTGTFYFIPTRAWIWILGVLGFILIFGEVLMNGPSSSGDQGGTRANEGRQSSRVRNTSESDTAL